MRPMALVARVIEDYLLCGCMLAEVVVYFLTVSVHMNIERPQWPFDNRASRFTPP